LLLLLLRGCMHHLHRWVSIGGETDDIQRRVRLSLLLHGQGMRKTGNGRVIIHLSLSGMWRQGGDGSIAGVRLVEHVCIGVEGMGGEKVCGMLRRRQIELRVLRMRMGVRMGQRREVGMR